MRKPKTPQDYIGLPFSDGLCLEMQVVLGAEEVYVTEEKTLHWFLNPKKLNIYLDRDFYNRDLRIISSVLWG